MKFIRGLTCDVARIKWINCEGTQSLRICSIPDLMSSSCIPQNQIIRRMQYQKKITTCIFPRKPNDTYKIRKPEEINFNKRYMIFSSGTTLANSTSFNIIKWSYQMGIFSCSKRLRQPQVLIVSQATRTPSPP